MAADSAYAALIASLVKLSTAAGLPEILALSACAGFFLEGVNYALYGVAASYYPKIMRGTGSGASIAVGHVRRYRC